MYPRTNYEMTEADLEKILDACKPVPMIMLQCGMPSSPQENANRAWEELGKRMGFDFMTVQPGKGDRFFTAVPLETEQHREAREMREKRESRQVKISFIEGKIKTLQDHLQRFKRRKYERSKDCRRNNARNATLR